MKYPVPLFLVFLVLTGSSTENSLFTRLVSPPENALQSTDVMVTNVEVAGRTGEYTFNVTLRSSDTGCEQYANWWEVVDENGRLLHRRILGHSHVNEQPFTRSGGPVPVAEDQTILIRGHMNNSGYGNKVMKGSVRNGFQAVVAQPGFAVSLENAPPQPQDCSF